MRERMNRGSPTAILPLSIEVDWVIPPALT